jgi:hypothetical protein
MEILATKNKPFEDAIMECLSVAGESSFNEFKTKTEICNVIKYVPLS